MSPDPLVLKNGTTMSLNIFSTSNKQNHKQNHRGISCGLLNI